MNEHEHDHEHGHEHVHAHDHDHKHEHSHEHEHDRHDEHMQAPASGSRVLTIRCHSGLSGDIILTGLARLLDLDSQTLNTLAAGIMPELTDSLDLHPAQINAIGGWRTEVRLPHQHAHRTLVDILALLENADITPAAREAASRAFTILAQAEARVHGLDPDKVHFHEVGALDSILDTTLVCVLFDMLRPDIFRVSPLPVADGHVVCAHGVLPVPAPAVLELLDGLPVVPFPGRGETVTPTAVSLLRSLGADFGPWPAMRVERHVLAYGTRVFENAPNGTLFALGQAL